MDYGIKGMLWLPNNKETDTIEVKNPLAEDFRFQVADLGGEGATIYSVKGDGTKSFPAFVANLYLDKMSSNLLQLKGQTRSLSNRAERQKVVDDLIVNAEPAEGNPATEQFPEQTTTKGQARAEQEDQLPPPAQAEPPPPTQREELKPPGSSTTPTEDTARAFPGIQRQTQGGKPKS